MTHPRRPIAIDLYAGAGGMSCGFEQAGFDIVLAVDNDPYHTATHERNFPYGISHTASVSDLSAADLRRLARLPPDSEVDLLIGGPPCQGFSHMGLRDADDPRNSLVDHFVRIVAELRPRAFVMENVPGMNSGATRVIFDHAVAGLQAAGYLLTQPVQALNAVDYGVPQARRRLFILGVREDCGREAVYPKPVALDSRPTVSSAFEDLPNVDSDIRYFEHDVGDYGQDPSPTNWYARYARGIETDVPDYSRLRVTPAGLTGCIRVKHSQAAVALYAATRPGTMVPGHKLPRLDPRGVSPTLRAGTNSERGSHTAPRPVHPSSPRVITIREAARLHGYPDWFAFYPGKWHAYRQIGNSVCPPVAREVGLEIIHALGIDPAQLPRTRVQLKSEIQVAEAREPQHRRIPTGSEFPKVVASLWRQATAADGQIVPDVTLEGVEKAYLDSGANLPRVRPSRFVSELLRFRNADDLLRVPREAGFTLVAASDGLVGRWVRVEELSALPSRLPTPVRSGDLNSARPVFVESWTSTIDDLTALAENGAVFGTLGWRSARCERTMFGTLSQPPVADTDGGRAAILALDHGRLPPLVKMSKIADHAGCRDLILLAAVTGAHVLAARYRCTGESPVEVARAVFLVTARSATQLSA